MNTKLISKVTGKEFYIVDLITKFTESDHGTIFPNIPLTYRDGRYNKITITYKGLEGKSKNIFKDNKNTISITNIVGPFDNVELHVNSGLINIYKEYQFTICIDYCYYFNINAKLIELDEILPPSDSKMNEIKSLYNKIKSINLVNTEVFESNTVILGDWKINVLTNKPTNPSTDFVELIYNSIKKLYSDGMTKINDSK